MTLDEAKTWLGASYVMHPTYRREDHPHHSSYALVNVRVTFTRVRARKQQSFSDMVAQTKQKLRLVHGKVKVI